jgi:formate hydrogenlyase subunit 4
VTIFFSILQAILIPALSPLGVGLVRKLKARLQNRQGASVLQPYRDLWKLFHKDEIISTDASWIFRYAPFILFAVTLVVSASIPFLTAIPGSTLTSDVLVVIYTLAIGTFFLALAGMDTGGPFGGFGASREMTVSALAEGGLIFSLLTIALRSGTTDLFAMSSASLISTTSSYVPVAMAFVGFFIVLLAETARFPFDNPATHLELTMIHEAMILEHSGKRLALMEWASANKLLIFLSLGANIFFPWGIAHSFGFAEMLVSILVFAVKMLILYTAIAVLESSIAKFRFFRLPDLLMVSFILNSVAIAFLK